MFSNSNSSNSKNEEEAKANAKKEEGYENFLDTLFEGIYQKYGFYRSSKL